MAALPKLGREYALFVNEINKLRRLVTDSLNLEPKYQRLIAEVALIRLSFLVDNVSEIIFTKLLAGGMYLDGSTPKLLQRAASIDEAKDMLAAYKRKKPLRFLSWASAKKYREMIEYTFDKADHSYTAINAHSIVIREMKRVRNYVAHQSGEAHKEFRIVLQTHYGANVRLISAGQFLITSRLVITRPPSPIQWYLSAANIFIKELTRAP